MWKRSGRAFGPVLAMTLIVMLALASFASYLQSTLVEKTRRSAAAVAEYQNAYALVTQEYRWLAAVTADPTAEEGWQMTELQPRVLAAFQTLERVDDLGQARQFDRFLAIEIELQAIEWQVVTNVDDGQHREAVRQVEQAEPLMDEVTSGTLKELREHSAIQANESQTASNRSELLTAGTLAMLGVGVAVLSVTGRRGRVDRRRIEKLGTEDSLTGLQNRTAFDATCEMALAAAGVEGSRPTVVLLDLDNFKDVNDTLGYPFGDRLLTEVAHRLRSCIRDTDQVARLGGDEFAFLVTGSNTGEETASAITKALSMPFVIDGIELDVEASIGIATALAGQDVSALVSNADMAMYVAKDHKLGVSRFDPHQHDAGASRVALLGSLRRALDKDEIVLHYQPKVSLVTGDVSGAEALARWNHPTRGLIGPAEFIPALERTSLVYPFTVHVIEEALRQTRVWMANGTPVPVAVNVPARCLLDVKFPETIASCLAQAGVPGHLLCVEVTENVIVTDPELAIDVLRRIQSMGVKTSLDDFGTGYSSLAYLRVLPVDELKIDQSFVRDITSNHKAMALVRSIVDLGHQLGLSVVAEGVEDFATLTALSRLDCDVVQGYHFAKPQDAESFLRWKTVRSAQPWDLEVTEPPSKEAPTPGSV